MCLGSRATAEKERREGVDKREEREKKAVSTTKLHIWKDSQQA